MNLLLELLFPIFRWTDVWSFYRCRLVCTNWRKACDNGDIVSYFRSLCPDRDTEGYTKNQLLMLCRHSIFSCSFSQDASQGTLYVNNGSIMNHNDITKTTTIIPWCPGEVKEFIRGFRYTFILDKQGRIYAAKKLQDKPVYVDSCPMVKLFTDDGSFLVHCVDRKGLVYLIDGYDRSVQCLHPNIVVAGIVGKTSYKDRDYSKMVDIDGNYHEIMSGGVTTRSVEGFCDIIRIRTIAMRVDMQVRGDRFLCRVEGGEEYEVVDGVREVFVGYASRMYVVREDGRVLRAEVEVHKEGRRIVLEEVFAIG